VPNLSRHPVFSAALGQFAFGLRVWASVCLALFLAYWLQLDNPFWAGTSAGIVCQPTLGASLRKANFRLIGTVLGAVVVVLISAAFPQNRWGFLLTLAGWCGVCGFGATVLRNFASYGAALAGYTAVIIASDAISNPNSAFLLAIYRATEIGLGILCAGVVLVLTGRGDARARAATTIATIAREAGLGMRATLQQAGSAPVDSAPVRRALVARVSALDTLLDETVGESADLRVRSNTLQAAVDGLFAALSGWRMVATHLENVPPAQARADAALVLAALPAGPAIVMQADSCPAETRDRCRHVAHELAALQVDGPACGLVLAGAAQALLGLERALNGVTLLVEPSRAEMHDDTAAKLRNPDLLPAIINGLRSCLIVLVTAGFWIVTAWPSGSTAIIFGAIIVLLLSPRGDSAISSAGEFLAGTMFTSALAGIANFALLPGQEGFFKLALILGIFVVPFAALSAGKWHTAFFVATATNFVPLLAPANLPTFDTIAFYNATLAILVGVGGGVLVLALLPQLSHARRTERLRALTLRDLRRLTTKKYPGTARAWESLVYGRLSILPDSASPLARGELIAALYVGEAVLRFRQRAGRFGEEPQVHRVLAALGSGDADEAAMALADVDKMVASAAGPPMLRLRERAAILALSEALARHTAYFCHGRSSDALHRA
jgi:uncharacterized membrane protein YccC